MTEKETEKGAKLGPKLGRLNLTSGMRGARGELKLREFEKIRNEIHTRCLPFGWRRIQSLRAFRRAVLFGLFAWWVVGLLSLRLAVCSFDRGGFLRTSRKLVLGASRAPFWVLGGSLGNHFGVSGPLLGSILGVWGLPWASFLGLWGSSGASGALWGPPWPPKVPKAKFSHFFPSHFGLMLAPFWR